MRKGIACAAIVLCLCIVGQVLSNGRTTDPLGVAVSPQTLVLGLDQGGAVTVHTAIRFTEVDAASLTLNGVPVQSAWADSIGNLAARFDEEAVEATVAPSTAVVTLRGMLKDGTSFAGSDSVRVTD